MLIPKEKLNNLIPSEKIMTNVNLSGIKFLDYENDIKVRNSIENKEYEFLYNTDEYHELIGVLSKKGNSSSKKNSRISIITSIPLKKFTDIVIYDPAHPPINNYKSIDMHEAHSRTQSDFKGAKLKNRDDFCNYLLEGLRDERELHLPIINGWQSSSSFHKVIFISYHQSDKNCFYGKIYIPKLPIMQSDGQTQTSALFKLVGFDEAVSLNALQSIICSIEIELNVNESSAAQSFADRNGRGSKKNKNLVIAMDSSSPLSQLRTNSIRNTIFNNRVATGKDGAITVTTVKNIVDLSTLEQMIMISLTGNISIKPESFKHYHLNTLIPYVKKFLEMFNLLSKYFPTDTQDNDDPYRKKYTLGWPFVLKAISAAFYYANEHELKPISQSLSEKSNATLTQEEAFKMAIKKYQTKLISEPKTYNLDHVDLQKRLSAINWKKHSTHWIKLTGNGIEKDGSKKTWVLKSEGGQRVVKGSSQNNAVSISKVINVICGDNWKDLTKNNIEPIN